MARSFIYGFQNVPLIVDGAFTDNGVDGEAEINYWADGTWSIESISIETNRFKTSEELDATGLTSRWVTKQHVLDRGSPLHLILHDRLEHRDFLRRDIQDEVDGLIEDAREDAANFLADRRHDERMAVSA